MKLIFVLFLSCTAGFLYSPENHKPAEGLSVWVFLDPECPISQAYTLTLRKLYADFAPQGVTFRGIYDSPVIRKREIRRFHQVFQIPFPGEIDHDYTLARRWEATITPEVVLTGKNGEVLYRGAIDNWFYALGKSRSEPTEHYLRDALGATMRNEPILIKRTEAVGCLMNR